MTAPAAAARRAAPYADSHEQLADELLRLDLLLHQRVVELRADNRPAPEESAAHHLYITDAEVDRLLAHHASPMPQTGADFDPQQRAR